LRIFGKIFIMQHNCTEKKIWFWLVQGSRLTSKTGAVLLIAKAGGGFSLPPLASKLFRE